ncbi:MAG: hypothetical protein CM15mP69_3860 [Ectothiorhodospiraceae bacterium]|nr:MAG: hypothetical protein CM15mP69_3860 [Ectothiorhodospiraceae bacterium]
MKYSYTAKKRIRKNFGKLGDVLQMPNLIQLQMDSYNHFIGKNGNKIDYNKSALHSVFESVFPIYDYANNCKLEYTGFRLGKEEYTEEECRITGKSYSVPLKVDLKLSVNIDSKSAGQLEILKIRMFLGEMPIMTKYGTFIVNGTERVVVSQLHRSPGVFFDHDSGKTHSSGKLLFSARVIPYRGSWLDFEFDQKDIVYARIDRRRKIASTIILRALGYTTREILDLFYESNKITVDKGKFFINQNLEDLQGSIAQFDILHNKKMIVQKGKRITVRHLELQKKNKMKGFFVPSEFLWGKRISEDVIDKKTGEVLLNCNEQITPEIADKITDLKIDSFKILHTNELDRGPFICNTLDVDPTTDQDTALIEIYRMMRPGEPPTKEAATQLFTSLFQSEDRYDLSAVGRMKFNSRVGRTEVTGPGVLSNDDIISVLTTLINIRNGFDTVDDIDHLGNRRVKCVGEMVENVFRIGLVRVEKAVKERMSTMELAEKLQPKDIINSKPITATLKEFFGTSQLSQFMDQNNPLAEITHKRRISALGPGGLTRERAGFEVRDVHPTHYGRVCPIETPEGPNIGLINSLATYSRTNDYGFLETPYRIVAKVKSNRK